MPSKQEKMAAELAALSPPERARLERLAALANVSPEELWPDVWSYGFEDMEQSIAADLDADAYFKTNPGIDNEEVMRGARQMIEDYVAGKRRAG